MSGARQKLTILTAAALLAVGPAGGAAAQTAAAPDPDDVDLPLDLKTVSHSNDDESVTFTAETYEAFPDTLVGFKWGVDKDGDDAYDVIVFAEWDETELVGGVDDIEEEPIAEATVTRPAPNAVSVTFPVRALGKITSYRYQVSSQNDVNQNGEEDAGEQDFAPDGGFLAHDLAAP